MHNSQQHIDQLIKNKIDVFEVDTQFMDADFEKMQQQLPTAPDALNLPNNNPLKWFSLNQLLYVIAGIALLAIAFFIYNNTNSKKPNDNKQVQNTNVSTQLVNDTTFSDTPVVVYEIPKDPTKAPKRWVYRMKLDFNGKNSKQLPAKQYIDLSDVKTDNSNTTSQQNVINLTTWQSKAQVFEINPTIEQYVTSKYGQYFIEANTFATVDNQPATNKLTLAITEVMDYANIIAHELNTNFKNNYISTNGIIKLQVSSKTENLSQVTLKPIQSIIKTNRHSKNVQMFNITENGWLPNGQFQNEAVNETLTKVKDRNHFYFNIYHLNWINIGQFLNNTTTANMELELPYQVSQSTAYLILPNQQICTGVITNANKVVFKNVPQNQHATILFSNIVNRNTNLYLYNNVITNRTVQLTATTALTQAQAKAKLDALGKIL